jgi:copper chaperone CopZ
VTAVHVDLARGELAVTSSTEVDRSRLAAAVDEAGYSLV